MRIVSIRHHKERVESHSSLPFQRLSPLDLAVWEMGDFTSDSTLKFFLKKPGGFMRGGLPWGCYESGQQLDAKTIGQWKNLFSIGKKRRGVFPRGPGKQSPPHCRMTFIASFLSSFRSARRKLPRSSGLPPSERYLRFPDFSRKNSATAPEPIQDESLRKIDEDFDSYSSLN